MADTSKKTKAGNFQTSVGVQRKSIEEKRDVNMGGLKWWRGCEKALVEE